jgi:ElaB/YqjD/DUF883 family membrane-anchored ribosome-binding protein
MTDDRIGTAEVHSHLSSEPYKGEGMSGKFDTGGSAGARDTAEGLKERAGALADDATERLEEARDRAGVAFSRARDQAGELVDDAERALDRTGIPAKVREYPLAALGVAFGIGFLIAGRTESRTAARVKNQMRAMVVGGLVASLKDEAMAYAREQLSGMMEDRSGGRHAGAGGF